MNTLIGQLTNIHPSYFDEIAQNIMCNYIIKKGNREYAIVEIEFYLYTNDHRDVITYPRNTEAGQWFFHQSGIDITFKSRDIRMLTFDKGELGLRPQFGGILIRAIKPLNDENKSIIWGPQNSVFELWDVFNAFSSDNSQYPHLVEKQSGLNPSDLRKFKRWIDIKEPTKREEKIKEWLRRLVTDTEIKIDLRQYQRDVLDEVKSVSPESLSYMYRYICHPECEIKSLTTKDYSAKPRYAGLLINE